MDLKTELKILILTQSEPSYNYKKLLTKKSLGECKLTFINTLAELEILANPDLLIFELEDRTDHYKKELTKIQNKLKFSSVIVITHSEAIDQKTVNKFNEFIFISKSELTTNVLLQTVKILSKQIKHKKANEFLASQLNKLIKESTQYFNEWDLCPDLSEKHITNKIKSNLLTNADETLFWGWMKKIKEATQFQKAIFEHTKTAIISTNIDGIITIFNPAAEEMLGYSRNELVGKFTPEVFHDMEEIEERKSMLGRPNLSLFQTLIEFNKSCENHRTEWKYIRKNKSKLIVSLTISELLNNDGDVYGYVGVATDVTKDILAERALIESEAKFRSYIENAPIPITVLNEKGNYNFANEAAQKMFGYSSEELMKKSFRDLLTASSYELGINNIKNIIRQGKIELDLNLRRKDGRRFWATVYGLKLDSNNFIFFHSDITEKIKSRESIAHERAMLKNIIHSIPDIVFIKDLNGKYLTYNKAFLDFIDSNESEIVNSNKVGFFDKKTESDFIQQEKQIFLKGEPVQTEEWIPNRFNEKILFDVLRAPLVNSEGNMIGLITLGRDITESKRIKTENEVHANRIQAILKTIPDILFVLNSDLIFTEYYTANAESLYIQMDKISGTHISAILTNQDVQVFGELVRNCLSSGEMQLFEYSICPSGEPLYYETRISKLNENHVITLVRDITERKNSEHVIQSRNEMQRLLMSLASNFINIPLEEIDEAINKSLRSIGEFVNVDRAYLFSYDFDAKTTSNTHEWCNAEIQPEIDNLQDVPMEMFPTWVESHLKGENVYIPFVEDLPDESGLRQILEPQGIKSLIAVPLIHENKPIGFIGFDSVVSVKVWTETERDLLKFLAELFTNAHLRKEYEQAITESEKNFVLATESSNTGVWHWDIKTGKFGYNAQQAEMIGFSANELEDDFFNYTSHIHPDDLPSFHKNLQYCIDGYREAFSKEFRFKHKNGSWIWIQARGSVVGYSDDGAAIKMSGIHLNITNRKNAEEALRDSEEKFRLLAENVSDVFWLRSGNNQQMIYINPAYERVFGKTIKGIYENPDEYLESIEPQDLPHVYAAYKKYTDGVEPLDMEYRVVKPDGEIVWIRARSNKIYDVDDSVLYHVGVATDITKLKQAEAALLSSLEKERELGELKSRFVSMASHEFRTPLATILATTESLSAYRSKMDNDQIDSRLKKIGNQVQNLKAIMDDVLDLSKIQEGKIQFNPEYQNIFKFVEEIIEEFRSHKNSKHEIVLECDDTNFLFNFDKKLMRQVVSNLISNAIKYSPDVKKVYVNLAIEKEKFLLRVRDEGIGIPKKDIDYLFVPFHRASNVGTISGTGLGLPITKQAVELHKGIISVKSEINVGTTFICTFN